MADAIRMSLYWKYKHFPPKHRGRVGEEMYLFSTRRDRRTVALRGERISVTALHTASRGRSTSPPKRRGCSAEGQLLSFYVLHDARRQAAAACAVAGPVRRELPAGWQGCTAARRQHTERWQQGGHPRTASVLLPQEQTSGQAGETMGIKKKCL